MSRLRKIASDLLNWLNGIGSALLAYALLNPNAAQELLSVLPHKFQTPVALMLPATWFIIVQYAKARTVAKATGNAS